MNIPKPMGGGSGSVHVSSEESTSHLDKTVTEKEHVL